MTKNVTTVRGGGKVHYGMPGMQGHHFPNCRTGAMTNSGTKYAATSKPVDCRNCIALHVGPADVAAGLGAAAAAISASGQQPAPAGENPAVAADVEKARAALGRMGQHDLDDPDGFYGVSGFRVQPAELDRYPGAIKVTRQQGRKYTSRPTDPAKTAAATVWDKGMTFWGSVLTAVGFRLVRTTDDALYLYGPRETAADAAPEAEAEPPVTERAREVLTRAGKRDAGADASVVIGFRLVPLDGSTRQVVRVGRVQEGDVIRPRSPIPWQAAWDRGVESYATALETAGFRVLVVDDEGAIVEWPTPGQAVDAARAALTGAGSPEIIPTGGAGFTLTEGAMDTVTVGRVQGPYRTRPTGHALASQRWDDTFADYRRTLVDHGFMVMTYDDDSLTVKWLGDPMDQWRPGAVPLVHPPQGADQQEPAPVDQPAGRSAEVVHVDRARWDAYAATAAELMGLPAADLVPLRIRNSAVYRDCRNHVIVKIGRPGTVATAQTELRAAWWLQTAGMPIAAPISSVPVMVSPSRPATCWTDLGDTRTATGAELGELHRRLHALPIPDHFTLTEYDPWRRMPERLHMAQVTEAQREWLRSWSADLLAEWIETRDDAPQVLIHGDAGPYNTLRTDAGAVLIDWETIAIGDPLVDLVNAAHEEHPFTPSHPGYADAHAAAYGADPREMPGFRLYWSIRTLRALLFACRHADTSPATRAEADHRLATLIEDRPKPWRWTGL